MPLSFNPLSHETLTIQQCLLSSFLSQVIGNVSGYFFHVRLIRSQGTMGKL